MDTIFNFLEKHRKIIIFLIPFGILWTIMSNNSILIRLPIGVILIVLLNITNYIDGVKYGESLYSPSVEERE